MAKKKDEKPAAKADKPAAKPDKGAAKPEKGAKAEKGEKSERAAAKPAEAAPVAEKAAEIASKVVEGVKNVVGTIAEKLGVAQDAQPAAPQPAGKRHGFRRRLVGRVTSNKMDKTVTVEVVRDALDPVYKKYVRMRDRYKAHDETNQYKVGDRVEITEHRPISRDKRWLVTRLISRPVEE
jgi:small subunit ribosomal protein S17